MFFSPVFEAYAEQLKQLYFADQAYYVVTPLTREAIKEVRGGILI